MTTDPVSRLVGEVGDLLGASSVGLYEFIWILRGAFRDASEDDLRAWAGEALTRLLAERGGRLALLRWPSEDIVEPELGAGNFVVDWADPVAGEPYVAIVRH